MPQGGNGSDCIRCQAQVIICSICDRGNCYCSSECSAKARSESLKRAGKRYQSSRCGRHKHAERQRRYRNRQKIVTHQGIQDLPISDLLPPTIYQKIERKNFCCYFCQQECSLYVRLDFMNRKTLKIASGWPFGP